MIWGGSREDSKVSGPHPLKFEKNPFYLEFLGMFLSWTPTPQSEQKDPPQFMSMCVCMHTHTHTHTHTLLLLLLLLLQSANVIYVE